MMQTVTAVETGSESRGSIQNGKIVQLIVSYVWILTLDCGHRAKRPKSHPEPPKKVKCGTCAKTLV